MAKRKHSESSEESASELEGQEAVKENGDAVVGVDGEDINFEADEKEGQLDVEFIFGDFADSDFHMVKGLLEKSNSLKLAKLQKNISDNVFSDLADSLVANKGLGTVIRLNSLLDDEGEPSELCAFVSLIHLTHENKDRLWSKRLCKMVPEQYHTNQTAVIFLERIVNVPYQILLPLHQSVIKDLDWARSNCTEFNLPTDTYDFTHFVVVANSYKTDKKEVEFDLDHEAQLEHMAEESIELGTQVVNDITTITTMYIILADKYLNIIA